MRKILVLAILFAFVSSFNASAQQSITLPCGDSLIVKTQPGRETVELKKNKKPYYPPARGTVNNFTAVNINSGNNNNSPVYPQSAQNNCRQCGRYGCADHNHFTGYTSDNSWLPVILVLGLIAWIIYLATRGNSSSGTSSVTHSHTHTHTYPPAPKPEVSTMNVKDEEVKTAMEKAEKSGSTFVRYGNGGYRIDFTKPPVPAAEAKKEN